MSLPLKPPHFIIYILYLINNLSRAIRPSQMFLICILILMRNPPTKQLVIHAVVNREPLNKHLTRFSTTIEETSIRLW